jgi:hypothetical protein
MTDFTGFSVAVCGYSPVRAKMPIRSALAVRARIASLGFLESCERPGTDASPSSAQFKFMHQLPA